jgi:glycosyltransferase involved in cell wall biosynthesis
VVLAGSRAAATSFGFFGFDCRPDYPLGLFPAFRRLPVPRAALRERLGLPRDGRLLIYSGRLEPDKDVLGLMDAFARVRRAFATQLLICFHYHQPEYLARCQERARELGGVHLRQGVERSDLAQLYNAADLFVTGAISLFETFGRSPVEALACGVPAVAPAFDGFRDTLGAVPGCALVPTSPQPGQALPALDRSAFVEAINRRLAEGAPGDGEARAAACVRAAARFQRRSALRALVELLVQRRELGPGPQGDQGFSVKGCAPVIADAFGAGEGRSAARWLTAFLAEGRIPARVSPTTELALKQTWFAHY